MFRNNIKIAWRSLVKNKFYSIVNITGLAIGLAVGIMILLWVQDEFSYDSFHKKADNIYTINSHLGTGADAQIWSGSPGPLAVYCKQSIPEVVNVVRLKTRWEQIQFTYG
ncbi:MAG TPA: ABC transporter permease, partial [Candidatus Paceibacterota bacterium]|nr:ABC transporter permease [Candidatus Paceibacterota bacterium]